MALVPNRSNPAGDFGFIAVTPVYFFEEEPWTRGLNIRYKLCDFLLLLILLTIGCVCSLAKGRDFEFPAMVELGMLPDLTRLVSALPTPDEVTLLCAKLGNSPSLMGILCTKC
ncbi:hypothetical protein VPH35_010479 [Triticum aestivum]